jgi:hypothetical protein
MDKCPLCRTSLQNSYFIKSNLLKQFIENTDKDYDIVNYYNNSKTPSIVKYYSRNYNIECPICYEKLTEPIVLSCGHTICSKCNLQINWRNISLNNKYNELISKNEYLKTKIFTLLSNDIAYLINENNELFLKLNIIKEDIKWKNRQHNILTQHDQKIIRYQNVEINELKMKLAHLRGQNTSLKEMIRVSPRYVERTKICRFWLRNKCKFSNEKCRNAHGEQMLNTFYIY